ncbi:6-phosphofructokinase [Vallitalea sediminicola]
MKNAIVAQSGGPTAVINASAIGVISSILESKCYDKIYGGINGIQGILQKKIVDLSHLDNKQLERIKYTPSSFLGSCRYKLKDHNEQDEEYLQLFKILDELEVQTLFYIGGNDSMDTVSKLSDYVQLKGLDKQIIGIPKTIDNDLCHTDHTPGYGSTVKYIVTTILETYLDFNAYDNKGIFILETMGRDTGWLAASGVIAKINGKAIVDFIYLPEIEFSQKKFLEEIAEKYIEKKIVYIVVSEGIKDKQGRYFFGSTSTEHDAFSHSQLGGVSKYLKKLIVEKGITTRVKTFELNIAQRCSMHCVSHRDIEESYLLGKEAVIYSNDGYTGFMVGIKRKQTEHYEIETFRVEASTVANNIKYFPAEWINTSKNNIKKDAIEYISPLIATSQELLINNGLPNYFCFEEK